MVILSPPLARCNCHWHFFSCVCLMASMARSVNGAIATGKLDLCILFGAKKSRTAAILLSELLALDKEGRCHFQVICKENTGTRSFANMLLYLEVSTDLRLSIGRFVADSQSEHFFLLRAPFGQYGPVAAFELYLYPQSTRALDQGGVEPRCGL